MREYTKCGIVAVFTALTVPATASSDMSGFIAYANGYEQQNYEHPNSLEDLAELIKKRVEEERTSGMKSSGYRLSLIQEIGVQAYLNISGNYTTIWNESLVANDTCTYIVSDLDGDGNPDVLVHTRRYDPATDIDTSSILAKKGIDGTQLWEETVTATGENNCTILPLPSGDLDGDGLNDVIIAETVYEAGAETAKVIAKKGRDGTQLWVETVTASGKDNCDILAFPVGDLDGDELTDVIVTESKYDETTNTTVARVIAKQGSNGTQMWEESVNAAGKDNCDMDALPVGDLDGDELADVIVTESKYDETTNTTVARVIAKQGSNGTQMWEESVNATGKDNCDLDVDWAGNLDGDGLNDVIVNEIKYDGTTETARVIAKQGSNGTHLWEESVNAAGNDICNIFAVYAGDLDGDGLDDVIVSEFKGNEMTFMMIYRIIAKKGNTGAHMWEESVTGMAPAIYALPIGDLDGDGLNDVIVSEIKYDETTFMPIASVIAKKGKTGAHMWEVAVTGAAFIYASPAGDLDGDGLNDVIVSEHIHDQSTDTTTARVIAKKGKDGTQLLEAQSNESIWVAMGAYGYDLNGDGRNDLVLGIPTEIYALTCIHGAVNKTPVAAFTYSPASPVVNQTLTFNASTSYDPDGFITGYEWQFDDGANATGEVVTHTYTSAGNYTVNLTVTDNATATNTTSKVIRVQSSTGITFDTGEPANPYPSIAGIHKGTITHVADLVLHRMYTYPCPGTGGHSEYIKIEGHGLAVNATWSGYDSDDWHNITFDKPFVTLEGNKTYNFTIRTGSYPQIIHESSKVVAGGTINCTEFVDLNGKENCDWIPAIRID
ncbi:PKD repeat-containing protein [Candidatus Methanophagaceae archaeon]|nr:PKD repeat-containing protein [Methanophagales archaeon]